MDTKALDSIMQAASKAGEAHEVIFGNSEVTRVRWDNGVLAENTQRVNAGVGLSLVKKGKLGFANRTDTGNSAALVEAAARLSEHGSVFDYTFAPKAESKTPEFYEADIAGKDAEYLFDLCDMAKAMLADAAPEALFSAGASLATGESLIATSAGQIAKERYARVNMSVSTSLNTDGDFLQTYGSLGSGKVIGEKEVKGIVARAAQDFVNGRKHAAIKEGSYRVLLSPDALSDALTPITVCANGLNIEKKISRWVDALDTQVFGENITIWDDPSHPDGAGSSSFDGEAVPTQRRPLIQKGILKSFAHSRSSASRCGVEATGNAMRSAGSKPTPGFHNIIMEGGEYTLPELMTLTNGGLMIRHLIGVFTSNFLAGQVSGNVMTGFRVEGGECAGRVKNAAINFNLFDVFNGKVIGISKEREWVGSEYLPYVLVDAVALSAS